MRSLRLLSAALLATAPLGAQGFQGIITMRSGVGEQAVTMRVHVSGGKTAVLVPFQGPTGSIEARMVVDPVAKKMTMLVPMPMGAAKGMKTSMDLSGDSDGTGRGAEPTIRALGSSQRIAGMSCDDFAITSDGETSNVCLTSALGGYMIPSVGNRPGARPSTPSWARGLENRFPLKVWRPDGTVLLLVEQVERGPVPAAIFDVNPEGYTDMSGMVGGRRGN